jgi:hypothetical protein
VFCHIWLENITPYDFVLIRGKLPGGMFLGRYIERNIKEKCTLGTEYELTTDVNILKKIILVFLLQISFTISLIMLAAF